ncbi:MAG: hypothetical protein NTY38_08660 [Acidobacteria bacterium]|nr:hypothetical protein [Acidobacteriota bacterium]
MHSFRLCTVFILLAALPGAVHAEPLSLDTWRGAWTPYRLVDSAGVDRRLAKATIEFPAASTAGWSLALRNAAGLDTDVESIPPGKKGAWSHGFWVPRTSEGVPNYTLELREGSRVVSRRTVSIEPGRDPIVNLPLRLDRLDPGLQRRLEAREQAAVPHPVADVVPSLRQHDIVYQSPSPGWDEGLPLGNGDVGALVAGVQRKEQVFYLDKTDIWLATAGDEPLGRSYAGTLRVRYSSGAGPFLQRLSLGSAEVDTRDGSFRSLARIHAMQNRFELDIYAPEVEISMERKPVTLFTDRKAPNPNGARLFGSWSSGLTPPDYAALREEAGRAPATTVEWGRQGPRCWFTNTAPNMRYSVAVEALGAIATWEVAEGGCVARLRAAGGGPIRLRAGIATSRESASPLALARERLAGFDHQSHLNWWRNFWRRSWIELPDKLEENLWYTGVYQQGACSRSSQAVSFFGLWHPLDHRTWWDAYAHDAQVEMMWWLPFATNHLELLYPSHRTFGAMNAEYAEHTAAPGMVMSMLVPEWAGGHGWFTGTNPFKGSTAWYTMNFWWDYLYSGDRGFLREVTYPMMRMTADNYVADLVKEADGLYHCLNSGSPEQLDTARDNIYDWAMLKWFFRTILRASEVLDVDQDQRARWRDILDHLFPYPTDGKTVWEAPNNAHPYRCHPVLFFGLHPTWLAAPGSEMFDSYRRTLPIVTRLAGFRWKDRHDAIPAFEGGVEPNGFSSGILTISAARLGDPTRYRDFFDRLVVRFHMKQNGLRALADTRHSDDISRASLVEAANAQTVATTETMLQSWDDHLRLFPCIQPAGKYRFHGLRGAGGFVVSAEARDGRVRWAQITSLLGGPLALVLPSRGALSVRFGGSRQEAPVTWSTTADGKARLTVATQAGMTYELLDNPAASLHPLPTPAPRRVSPRRTPILADPSADLSLVHYPEDLPFGQKIRDANLYLGRPAAYGPVPPVPGSAQLIGNSASGVWQIRLRAARLLGGVKPDEQTLAALHRLCSDKVNVVAHTAAVSLVRLRTKESQALARKHARDGNVVGLKDEVAKACKRWGCSD